jgi:chromosome segregation ATPase
LPKPTDDLMEHAGDREAVASDTQLAAVHLQQTEQLAAAGEIYGRILEVGRGFDADEQVDVSGKAILPGLFDCHTHVMFSHIDFLKAMEELGSMEERRGFLANEKADLERSLADLQKTIANLNRMSRDRFSETFVAVNEMFQETFPKLFRGARAHLALTDESDLMSTGVDIRVQPPGMNLRALTLLSGGQKALTAVSLIFSLFMCRPSPFCVLDEVDAPLDDANIDRFNQIVTEMGRESQFLIITHNQRTMEVADCLYGVTMEEPGVSRIVSVRLQSAA